MGNTSADQSRTIIFTLTNSEMNVRTPLANGSFSTELMDCNQSIALAEQQRLNDSYPV
jgi:hypothetical protein